MPFGLHAEEIAAQVFAGHEATAQVLDDHRSPRWFE